MNTFKQLRWKFMLLETWRLGNIFGVLYGMPYLALGGWMHLSWISLIIAFPMFLWSIAYFKFFSTCRTVTIAGKEFHSHVLNNIRFAKKEEIVQHRSRGQHNLLMVLYLLGLPGYAFVEEWIFRYNSDTFAEKFLVGCVAFAASHYFLANYNLLSTINTFVHGVFLNIVYAYGGLELSFSVHLAVNVFAEVFHWLQHKLKKPDTFGEMEIIQFPKKKKMKRIRKFTKNRRQR